MEPFLDDVDKSFVDREVETDIGVAFLKVRKRRRDDHLVGAPLQSQTQGAGGRLADGARAFDRVRDVGERGRGACEQRATGFGQFDGPGGAHQEIDADPLFQRLELMRDGGRADAQRAARRGGTPP